MGEHWIDIGGGGGGGGGIVHYHIASIYLPLNLNHFLIGLTQ